MPQKHNINVKIHPADEAVEEPIEFEGIHYISFVSTPGGQGEGTWGIPAILSETRYKADGLPLRVLYVNPANICAMEAERLA